MAAGERLWLTRIGSVHLNVLAGRENPPNTPTAAYLAPREANNAVSCGNPGSKNFALVYDGHKLALVRRSDGPITFDVTINCYVLYVETTATRGRHRAGDAIVAALEAHIRCDRMQSVCNETHFCISIRVSVTLRSTQLSAWPENPHLVFGLPVLGAWHVCRLSWASRRATHIRRGIVAPTRPSTGLSASSNQTSRDRRRLRIYKAIDFWAAFSTTSQITSVYSSRARRTRQRSSLNATLSTSRSSSALSFTCCAQTVDLFCKRTGVAWHDSETRRLISNGKTERMHQTVLNLSRSMMFACALPELMRCNTPCTSQIEGRRRRTRKERRRFRC